MYDEVKFLRASSGQLLNVWVEPWGDGFALSPGSIAELRATSTLPGMLEIDNDADRTTVYAWPGSTLKVFVNGELIYDFSVVVPDIPGGLDMKGFVKALFRETPGQP